MSTKTTTVVAYSQIEAARRLGVSRWTIRRAIAEGKLAATPTGTKSMIIYADDLLDYVLRYRNGRGIEG